MTSTWVVEKRAEEPRVVDAKTLTFTIDVFFPLNNWHRGLTAWIPKEVIATHIHRKFFVELGADNMRWHLHWLSRTKRPHCLDRTTSTASSFWNWERTSGGGHRSFMQCPTLAFTVDVCFQLKNMYRQTKPTGRTCSDSNLLAMQVFVTFAEVTGGGATGRACDDNNSHSLHEVVFADTPTAGRAFCDSDLQAVMHVSLAFWICHDRWKGHHNYMQHIQSIWQRSAMGQLRWNLPSRYTGGGLRILWQWPAGRYACFPGFFDLPRSLKRSPQLQAIDSIVMAA